jgi:hypothetical protein
MTAETLQEKTKGVPILFSGIFPGSLDFLFFSSLDIISNNQAYSTLSSVPTLTDYTVRDNVKVMVGEYPTLT